MASEHTDSKLLSIGDIQVMIDDNNIRIVQGTSSVVIPVTMFGLLNSEIYIWTGRANHLQRIGAGVGIGSGQGKVPDGLR